MKFILIIFDIMTLKSKYKIYILYLLYEIFKNKWMKEIQVGQKNYLV